MKSNDKKNAVPFRYIVRVIALMIIFILSVKCSEEGTPVTRDFDIDDLVGNVKETTWILKSAVLDTPFDPDGEGPILPLSDIKPLIYQMFHFYDNCSSIDDIPIQFKIDESADYKYELWAICPEGQGVSSKIGTWRLDTNPVQVLWWYRPEIDDPAELIWWTGFLQLHPHGVFEEGRWIISGTGHVYFYDKTDPEEGYVLAMYSFVLEEIKP